MCVWVLYKLKMYRVIVLVIAIILTVILSCVFWNLLIRWLHTGFICGPYEPRNNNNINQTPLVAEQV